MWMKERLRSKNSAVLFYKVTALLELLFSQNSICKGRMQEEKKLKIRLGKSLQILF